MGEIRTYVDGALEKPDRCIEYVYDHIYRRPGLHAFQCRRPRGYGPGKAYCKQHAALVAKREAP